MTTAAITMAKDEADIVRWWLEWTLSQVDAVYVLDNGSVDGTSDTLAEYASPGRVTVIDDPEVAYYQSRKMTALAQRALQDGHDFVVAADVDEFWHVNDHTRRIADFLSGLAPDVQIVGADLYHHLPTARDDPDQDDPFRRIGWRKRERAGLGKVAARTRPDLVIDAGNHSARTTGTALRAGGLIVRHYSWRSEEQYVRKIRNGIAAYAATSLPDEVGAHWRMWKDATDEQIIGHYRTWFFSGYPHKDSSLMYDPAPLPAIPPDEELEPL